MAYIDPIESSPANNKLLFEDEKHRVLEMSVKAGEKDNEHSHPAEVVYFISGGSAMITLTDGQVMEADIPDGHVMASEAWTHTVENTGTKDIRAIIFEVK